MVALSPPCGLLMGQQVAWIDGIAILQQGHSPMPCPGQTSHGSITTSSPGKRELVAQITQSGWLWQTRPVNARSELAVCRSKRHRLWLDLIVRGRSEKRGLCAVACHASGICARGKVTAANFLRQHAPMNSPMPVKGRFQTCNQFVTYGMRLSTSGPFCS